MTDQEINELLSDLMAQHAPAFGRGLTKKVAQKIATSSTEQSFSVPGGNPYALAKAALCRCGTLLTENDTDYTLFGIILAGAANMNPAFAALWAEPHTVHIKATAKEGLIPQHTAEQAVTMFAAALEDAACEMQPGGEPKLPEE